jgi:FkbM family methyltransferase
MGTNAEALAAWYRDRGDETLSLDYALTEKSLVFEVGGYEGLWASKIVQKYDPYMHIFEPVKNFYETIANRFRDNQKVGVFNVGLTDHNGIAPFILDGDRTHSESAAIEMFQMRDIAEIIDQPIDLININIEGGEYQLLQRMLDSDAVTLCRNIQIQFHDDYPNCVELRNQIREKLAGTHVEIYNYPFVWEAWTLREN